jgi:hypothetical protein
MKGSNYKVRKGWKPLGRPSFKELLYYSSVLELVEAGVKVS